MLTAIVFKMLFDCNDELFSRFKLSRIKTLFFDVPQKCSAGMMSMLR